MKIKSFLVVLIILAGEANVSIHAQTGPPWVKYNVGFNYILRGIDFPSDQDYIGFTAGESLTYNGNGIVLKTTDGGNTWTQVWYGANEGIEGCSFPDVNTGYIAGWPKPSAGWYGVGKTTDGGATWTPLSVTTDVFYFTDIVFKDADNGIVLGSTGIFPGVWLTSNGGATWTPATGIAGVPNHACHISGNTYFLIDNGGNIKKSTNNGASWITVKSVPGLLLLGIDHEGDDIIMACGDNGVIIKSYDGGATWTTQTIGSDLWGDFGWETPDHVILCGTPELVAESADSGVNWQNAFPQSAHDAALYECVFTPNGTGFICGSQGTLLKRLPSCTAGFLASATVVCTGNPVTFTDQSYGNNLAYNWWFEGGTPSTSAEQNPVIVYSTPGTFDVRLIVSNGNWSDTLLKTDYIQVYGTPATPLITATGFTLSSSTPDGNQWYRNGSAIPGATGQVHEATQTGNYWDVVTSANCSSDTSNNIYLVMTGSDTVQAPELEIYPVPVIGRFTVSVKMNDSKRFYLNVYDPLGTRIRHYEFPDSPGKNAVIIDLENPSAGLYVVELVSGQHRVIRKVVAR